MEIRRIFLISLCKDVWWSLLFVLLDVLALGLRVYLKSWTDLVLQPGGGYIVTPLKTSDNGKLRTLVEVVLEMDVAGWSSLLGAGFSSYPVHLRDSLLGVVAGASLALSLPSCMDLHFSSIGYKKMISCILLFSLSQLLNFFDRNFSALS